MGFQQPIVKISSVSFGYSNIVFSLSSLLFYWYTTKGSLTSFIFYLFFLLPWAIFLVLSLFFFFTLVLSTFSIFFICSLLPFPPQRSLLFFFYSFTPPPNSFPTFFRSFTLFKFTFSPLLFQSNSLFLFLKASISLLKPLSTGITYSHVYFHYRDSRVL